MDSEYFKTSYDAFNLPLVLARQSLDAGIELYKRGLFSEAIEQFSKAIQQLPTYIEAFNNRGMAYRELKKYSKAFADYNAVIRMNKGYAPVWNNRGLLNEELLHYSEAIEDFSKAIALDTRNTGFSYLYRGEVYMKLKNYKKALEDFTSAIKRKKKFPFAYFNRGLAYVKLEESGKAIPDFTKALSSDKKYAPLYYHRGVAFKNLGKLSEAFRDLNQALVLDKPEYLAKQVLEEDVFKPFYFVQRVLSVRGSIILEVKNEKAVCYLPKKVLFGRTKNVKLYEGGFRNGKFHGEGIAYDQKTGKEIYKGNWEDGYLRTMTSGSEDAKRMFQVKSQEIETYREQRNIKKEETTEISQVKLEIARVRKNNIGFQKRNATTRAELTEARTTISRLKTESIDLLTENSKLKELIGRNTFDESEKKELGRKDKEVGESKNANRRQQDTVVAAQRDEPKDKFTLNDIMAVGEEFFAHLNLKESDSVPKLDERLNSNDEILIVKEKLATQLKVVQDLRERNVKNSLKEIPFKDLDIHFLKDRGSGACADVCEAHLKTRVALKRIKAQLVRSKKITLNHVKEECRKIGCINHENVIKCFGFVNDPSQDLLGILLELGKESLEDALKRSLTFSRKLSLMAELAEGMVFLHDNKIVHRDLNLRNVLVGYDGKIKIIDFDHSKQMIDMKTQITRSSFHGTPFFFAPEILKEGVMYTDMCDVFSFGVCCFCMYHNKTKISDLEQLLYKGTPISTLEGQIKITEMLLDPKWKPKDPKNFDRSKISSAEKSLLELIESCLQVVGTDRPSFKEIVVKLKEIVCGERQTVKKKNVEIVKKESTLLSLGGSNTSSKNEIPDDKNKIIKSLKEKTKMYEGFLVKKDKMIQVLEAENKKKQVQITQSDAAIKDLKQKILEYEEQIAEQKNAMIQLREKNKNNSVKEIPLKDLDIHFLKNRGSGACADVCEASLRVALKKIKPQLVRSKNITLADVKSECQKMSSVNHENVIKCFGYVNDPSNDLLGILLELGEQSLDDALKNGLELSKKVSLMRELADGMLFLHDNNIVHRDLNLRNVLVGYDGKIKIIDFDHSKQMAEMKTKITHSSFHGTPFFFAPEILKEGVMYTNMCDVFSFGVCCFCMYHGISKTSDLEMLLYRGAMISTLEGQIKIAKMLLDPKWKPEDPKNFDRSTISSAEKSLLELIESCLQVVGTDRPSFTEIVVKLKDIEKLIR